MGSLFLLTLKTSPAFHRVIYLIGFIDVEEETHVSQE